jgi:ABC-type lipoprotein export system ATPase subunit
MAYIECRRLVKVYKVGQHELLALRGIDFDMQEGEWVAIIGPSGAGKSSLLNLLGGLDTPTAGQLIINGLNLLELKGGRLADYRLRRVGFVWQQVNKNLLSHRTALGNVILPMMLAGVSPRERNKRARELLGAVGISEHLRKRPAQLSGGQQQRVAVAVALANHPPLLLADEPTGALDRQSADQVMDLFLELRERYGLTILMVSHDLDIAGRADRVLTLRDGALGQDLTHPESPPSLDVEGRIQLPEAVRAQLSGAPRIGVEVRPEGVLLRPETDDEEVVSFQEMLPQDAPPEKRRLLGRLLRRKKKVAS